MPQTQSTGPLWRLPRIETETGLSKSEIYRRIKLGTFPAPLKLGVRAVAWPAQAVQAWVQALIQGAGK
jgi:prophage regulatory protein